MPKMKTHSGAGKRFRTTKTGKVKRKRQNSRHILTKKAPKRKRQLRQQTYVDSTQEKTVKKLI